MIQDSLIEVAVDSGLLGWGVTLCRWVFPVVSKGREAYFFNDPSKRLETLAQQHKVKSQKNRILDLSPQNRAFPLIFRFLIGNFISSRTNCVVSISLLSLLSRDEYICLVTNISTCLSLQQACH
jgi:hypothetical protein